MVFITNNQPPKVLQPCKQPLDFPAFAIPSHRSAVLRFWPLTIFLMRYNQRHIPFIQKLIIQFIRIIGFVTDQSFRQLIQHARIQRLINQRYFMRRSAACVQGERNTFSVAKAHDFGAFAPFGLANAQTPFYAGASVPSINPSLRSMPPRSRKSSANATSTFSKTPLRVQSWKRRWQVLRGGYLSDKSFHGAPVRKIQRMPLRISRGSTAGHPCRPGPLRGNERYEEIRFHCSSVMSITLLKQRPYHGAS